MLAAMLLLGLGLGGNFCLILGIVSEWGTVAPLDAAAALVLTFGLRFGYPIALRRRHSPVR